MGFFDFLKKADGKTNLTPKKDNDADDTNSFLLTITDVFSIAGRGTVVTGKISSGVIKVNDKVVIAGGAEPREAKVTSIEKFNKTVNEAKTGDEVGLLLNNINKNEVGKGYTLVKNEEQLKSLIIKTSTLKEINYTDDLWEKIPSDVKELLFCTSDNPKPADHTGFNTIELSFSSPNIKYIDHVHNDPSTIYFKLPIQVPQDISLVDKLPYEPSYVFLSPQQRYVYLTWLQDISKDIDVGYKFLFYYGLERRLLLNNNFDEAFDMIIQLRKNTDNGSFRSHAGYALLFSLLQMNRKDLLNKLVIIFNDDIWGYIHLLLKTTIQEPIFPDETIKILKSMQVNKRYIQNEPKTYAEQMSKLLNEKYGHSYITVNEVVDINKLKDEEVRIYANISIPLSIRQKKIPIIDFSSLYKDLTDLHNLSHEMTKIKLAEMRKKT